MSSILDLILKPHTSVPEQMYKSLLHTHLPCKHIQPCFQDSIKSEIEIESNYGDAQQAEYPLMSN